MPQWIGYKQLVYSTKEKQDFSELRQKQREIARFKWLADWQTVWRLKNERLWTDGAIKRFLGKAKTDGKYKFYAVEKVIEAEQHQDFQKWLAPRLEKKLITCPDFLIPDLWGLKWQTASNLKNKRLWTAAAITKWLKPYEQNGRTVYSTHDVREIELRLDFKKWLAPRLDKKIARYSASFSIPHL
ncbi:hypothetical protein [Moritella sp. F3]|uniref:hypothetical protein n=1 Tax=Moritella sp. F3 TaxID=2718882 RepID=UPI0018E1D570|nr:hypothetical protein [Moritella sp. F3]GIC77165.1 hypothetical protein FMO001_18920 [Moritella sp. F1]GIC82284.1 hypothetical protein FMO003_25650 [Moritella sp. F3]